MFACSPVLTTPGLFKKVMTCWADSNAVNAVPKPKARPKVELLGGDETAAAGKLSTDQVTQVAPLMLRNTQVGSSVPLSTLHGKTIEDQMEC